jgi:hypothetical protein
MASWSMQTHGHGPCDLRTPLSEYTRTNEHAHARASRDPHVRTWGVLSTTAADAPATARFRGLLADHLDGVVSVARTSLSLQLTSGLGPGSTLDRLLQGLSSVPRDVERIAYVDDDVLSALGIEPILEMISWLDDDHAAVVRATPLTDALKLVDGRRIVRSIDREGLFVPQPPHIIRREALDAALLGSSHSGATRVDDPAGLLVAAGHAVRVVRDVGPPLTLAAAP